MSNFNFDVEILINRPDQDGFYQAEAWVNGWDHQASAFARHPKRAAAFALQNLAAILIKDSRCQPDTPAT